MTGWEAWCEVGAGVGCGRCTGIFARGEESVKVHETGERVKHWILRGMTRRVERGVHDTDRQEHTGCREHHHPSLSFLNIGFFFNMRKWEILGAE